MTGEFSYASINGTKLIELIIAGVAGLAAVLSAAGTFFSARYAAKAAKLANKSIEKSQESALSSQKSDKMHAMMDVIIHCNARYADLYKMKSDIHIIRHNKNVENGEKESKIAILKNTYFRQYWGLKSDQIDYWIAGYVDPNTLTSWFLSTADKMDKKNLTEDFSCSEYVSKWEQISQEHEAVNPLFCSVIDYIKADISEIPDPNDRFNKLFTFFRVIEETEKLQKTKSFLQNGRLDFENLQHVYDDSGNIETLYKNSAKILERIKIMSDKRKSEKISRTT